MKPINLGKKMGGPSISAVVPALREEMYYPSLHLDWEKPYDLPEEGTMLVKFRKTSESNTTRDGKTNQSVSLDILEIESVKGDAPMKSENPGDRIDALRKEIEDEDEGYE